MVLIFCKLWSIWSFLQMSFKSLTEGEQ